MSRPGTNITDDDIVSLRGMFSARGHDVKVRSRHKDPDIVEVELFTDTGGERWSVRRMA